MTNVCDNVRFYIGWKRLLHFEIEAAASFLDSRRQQGSQAHYLCLTRSITKVESAHNQRCA